MPRFYISTPTQTVVVTAPNRFLAAHAVARKLAGKRNALAYPIGQFGQSCGFQAYHRGQPVGSPFSVTNA